MSNYLVGVRRRGQEYMWRDTNAVHVDAADGLTEAQKARARENIGAAAAGPEGEEKELYIGSEFVLGTNWDTNVVENTNLRLCMKGKLALPYGENTVLHVSINPEYVLGIRAGQNPERLTTRKFWYTSGEAEPYDQDPILGDTITFDAHEQFYRFDIAKMTGRKASGEATWAEMSLDMLDEINLKITYSRTKGFESDLMGRNIDALARVESVRSPFSATTPGGRDDGPLLVHVSDVHGDYARLRNALEITRAIDADCALISGDIVSYYPQDGAGWMHEAIADTGVPCAVCVGNHDAVNDNYTDADVYNYLMAPSAAAIGNANSATYYYRDFADKKLRIICVDLYQSGGQSRWYTHMQNAQLTYICEALRTTPEGYGIIMMAHQMLAVVTCPSEAAISKFFQTDHRGQDDYLNAIDGAPLYDIVDAFIGRTTISKTYAQTGTPASISVSADFSGVSSTVEFIAHVTGHLHQDSVCYLTTAHRQLMLNIACAIPMIGGAEYRGLADMYDIARVPYGKSQDCINVYHIDRERRAVDIVRIGGSETVDFRQRDVLSIPYAE